MLALTRAVKKGLAERADPERAAGQQAYMKSEMPYHGVATPGVTAICRAAFKAHPFETQDAWHEAMLDLWRQAEYREEKYAAEQLAAVRKYRAFQTMKTLPIYREFIVDGAWWDLVDGIVRRLGELLIDHPAPMKKQMLKWSTSRSLWQRRSAIICQLILKDQTDEDLLFRAISNNFDHPNFFVRKGIGWALRDYSITAPETVIAFIDEHKNELSPLSKREGLKRLLKSGVVTEVP